MCSQPPVLWKPRNPSLPAVPASLPAPATPAPPACPAPGYEHRLLLNYNDKPLLTRPQHRFYSGPGYLEIDVDIHAYAYLARKALHLFIARLASVVFENAFVLQGGCGGVSRRRGGAPGRGRRARVPVLGTLARGRVPVLARTGCCGALHAFGSCLASHPPLAWCPICRAGNRPEELPEVLLGCARVFRVDFNRAYPFPAQSLDKNAAAAGGSGARQSLDGDGPPG